MVYPRSQAERTFEWSEDASGLVLEVPTPEGQARAFFPSQSDPLIFEGADFAPSRTRLRWRRAGSAKPAKGFGQGVLLLAGSKIHTVRRQAPSGPQATAPLRIELDWPSAKKEDSP